jgi:hypothetical protein
MFLFLVGEICYGLDGLSEAHVISQDAIGVLRGQVDHPLQGLQLVAFELSAHQKIWLCDLEVATVFVEEVRIRFGLDGLLDPFHQVFQ